MLFVLCSRINVIDCVVCICLIYILNMRHDTSLYQHSGIMHEALRLGVILHMLADMEAFGEVMRKPHTLCCFFPLSSHLLLYSSANQQHIYVNFSCVMRKPQQWSSVCCQ